MKYISWIISFLVSLVLVSAQFYGDGISAFWIAKFSAFKEDWPILYSIFFQILPRTLVTTILVYWIAGVIARYFHFNRSLRIIFNEMLPTMKNRLWQLSRYSDNKIIDNYIQSPIEYVNEIVQGNQAPQFNPDDTYQDVLYDENDNNTKKKNKIKYIVAITAENPNMFLDPTIGFYMSNCYAASLIRHVNEYIETTKHENGSVFQLYVRDLYELEDEIIKLRMKIINTLKRGSELESYEFIRIFMYDKHQKECCDNAIFPSLKASQDLFRTISFYIQKEEIQKKLENENEIENGDDENKWEKLKKTNEQLWHLFDDDCKTNKSAKKVQKDRIKRVVPEFLFVFYEKEIGIHSYLGGKYCKNKYSIESDEGKKIKELIKFLAEYISSNADLIKGDLKIGKQENKYNTFIDWNYTTA